MSNNGLSESKLNLLEVLAARPDIRKLFLMAYEVYDAGGRKGDVKQIFEDLMAEADAERAASAVEGEG